jgi:hypothetical protein
VFNEKTQALFLGPKKATFKSITTPRMEEETPDKTVSIGNPISLTTTT